ncbi:MAG TPA: SHOCT domain-containing protein [Lacunisphaera sp.]|nr:SHOCT domain-containing protein [Lacunisphaera sp.]
MTFAPFARIGIVLGALLLVPTTRASEISPVTSLGDNTYTLTVKASTKFTRNTTKLKNQGIEAAKEFCAKEGKQLKVLSAEEDKQMYLVGPMAKVVLTFKALAAGDPELVAAPGVVAMPSVAPAPPPPPPRITTDELHDELTKLDDMRKKGLLTDAEFDALKQKLLSRF